MSEPIPNPVDAAEILSRPHTLNDTLTLQNRIVMAPMTRGMADDALVPTARMAAYYRRRADAGLIITEGAIVRPDGQGYPNTPGIFNDAQARGWRRIAEQVHAAAGQAFMQLWHVGRVSHPTLLNGQPPVGPSAVPLAGRVLRSKGLEYGTPRALTTDEIPALVEAYAAGAGRALAAGFDGVEIHAANGYLIDQFLHRHTNRRTDAYGGTVENMARLALEVVDAVVGKVGRERVGIRLSPAAYHYMKSHPDDPAVFRHLLTRLEDRQLAYVHAGIADDSRTFDYLGGSVTAFLRQHYRGTLIGCGSYTPGRAAHAIAEGVFDLIAIGRPFIANPDLVAKVRRGDALTPYDESMLASLD